MEYQLISNNHQKRAVRSQMCPFCLSLMGDMPGSRDAYCGECGFKDPSCEKLLITDNVISNPIISTQKL